MLAMPYRVVVMGHIFMTFFLSAVDDAFTVRVKLAERTDSLPLIIKSDSGFVVSAYDDAERQHTFAEKTLEIVGKKGALYLNGKRLGTDRIIIRSPEGLFHLEGHRYQGDFVVTKIEKTVYLVNHIDLEDYVFSVLRWESWPGWPLEVNKAFAITCRTYVVTKILEVRNRQKTDAVRKLLFDIEATNVHQTYKGVHEFLQVKEAIDATRGIIMAYNERPIVAMYDSCCGGIIPAHIKGVNFAGTPYLARSYPCHYCKNSKLFNWSRTYRRDDFERLLCENGYSIKNISHISCSKDKAGLLQEATISSSWTTIKLSGKKLYSLFKDIKSYCFSLIKKGSSVVFEQGRGFGHHIGLCQWGAREMVKQGWHYKKILKFYYPGIQFMKIEAIEHAAV